MVIECTIQFQITLRFPQLSFGHFPGSLGLFRGNLGKTSDTSEASSGQRHTVVPRYPKNSRNIS